MKTYKVGILFAKVLCAISSRGYLLLPDKLYLKLKYYSRMGVLLDFKNPTTFNEKMQWLKIYDRKNAYTNMVDKYAVKQYVADIAGKEIIIPTIGVYNSFDDIIFHDLPKQFVIKCTHDSGGLVICKDREKLDIESAKKKINRCLKNNYYRHGREWPYKNVKPRIIIENYMIDSKTNELRDYKFFCFGGRVEYFKIDFDRFVNHRANYYDRNGKMQFFGEAICPPDYNKKLKMPKNLKKMIQLAEKLSEGIPFVRIDFYEANDKVYFGEITFFPASGFGKFIPEEWDKKLGDLIDLGLVEQNEN